MKKTKISANADGRADAGGRGGLFDRLNRRLLPYIGPPPLGPYDEAPVDRAPKLCPLCGRPMSLHEIDRSGERTQLYCPAA
jgi:hypothetical protein